MGQEATCRVRWGDRVSEGRALLETSSLIFRGKEFRLAIPFQGARIAVQGGTLRVQCAEGVAEFQLGEKAGKWARAILHPKGLLEKLGIKPGSRVKIVGAAPESFLSEVAGRVVKHDADLTLLFAGKSVDLKKIGSGPVWVVYPRGQAHITEADVIAAGRAAGLVDIKVARFSDTHTALKFAARKSG